MTQSKKIAITGGIGSGKSTVCSIIRSNGYPVYSCDEIYKEIQKQDAYLTKLQTIFGQDIVKNGEIDKPLLSKIVFNDKEQLDKLNSLAHPMIMERLNDHMTKHTVAFAEVPLLFECGYDHDFDHVIVVCRDEEKRIASVCMRDGLNSASVEERIKNQVNHEDFIKNEHTVIYNDGDIRELERKVLQALEKIIH